MGLMICGKCESESTYYQDGALACMKCGNRIPSRWGFHRKGEIKAHEPIEEYLGPAIEDEQEEEMNMAKKRTPEQIERIRAGILAARERKLASGGGKVEKKPKSAAAPLLSSETVARNIERAGLAPMNHPYPPDVVMSLNPVDPCLVILDFNLEENKHLLEPWTKYARTHRRGPGDQAMMLIEELLANEGLL